jgi:hypothetical protein
MLAFDKRIGGVDADIQVGAELGEVAQRAEVDVRSGPPGLGQRPVVGMRPVVSTVQRTRQ